VLTSWSRVRGVRSDVAAVAAACTGRLPHTHLLADSPTKPPRTVLTPALLADLHNILAGGTLNGTHVAGLVGIAELGPTGRRLQWSVACAPADRPTVAVAAFHEVPSDTRPPKISFDDITAATISAALTR
jgi:hypothetical protein